MENRLMFDEKQLQVIRCAARESRKSLAALMDHWDKILGVATSIDFHLLGVHVHRAGEIRVQGALSGVPAILTTTALHLVLINGIVWADNDDLLGPVIARFFTVNGKLHVENNVLDFILHREKLHEDA